MSVLFGFLSGVQTAMAILAVAAGWPGRAAISTLFACGCLAIAIYESVRK